MRAAENSVATSQAVATPVDNADVRARIRAYVVGNFLLGDTEGIDDDASLMEAGILDSTGALEIVAFLESAFGIGVRDDEITADNLDTIGRIGDLVERKLSASA